MISDHAATIYNLLCHAPVQVPSRSWCSKKRGNRRQQTLDCFARRFFRPKILPTEGLDCLGFPMVSLPDGSLVMTAMLIGAVIPHLDMKFYSSGVRICARPRQCLTCSNGIRRKCQEVIEISCDSSGTIIELAPTCSDNSSLVAANLATQSSARKT